ncbi:MAG: hypothetical protein SF123_16585 [Chloroflexota bacterium]|nr:hypothetical protein [Chloroflexota bacterium]
MKHLLIVLLLALAACAPAAAEIQQVTALPADFVTTAPEPSATVGPTLTPTSALAALFANAPTATPTPLDNNLEAGTAREIALATDVALHWTPVAPQTFEDEDAIKITFDEFYDGYDLRTGLMLSDKLLSLDGLEVSIEGYMAPPLKAELDYFVLTRIRLAFCPFCSNASDWPDDIALVYMEPGKTAEVTLAPIRIVGQMEVGTSVDEETGMVSLVRIYAHTLEIID